MVHLFLVTLSCSIFLSGLALCGVGYDAEQLSLKKHNLMRPGSLGSLSDCQLKSPNSDGSVRSKNDNAVSKRKLFEVSYCHSDTSSTFTAILICLTPIVWKLGMTK